MKLLAAFATTLAVGLAVYWFNRADLATVISDRAHEAAIKEDRARRQ